MSGGKAAARLVKALEAAIMAREMLIGSLPHGSRVTFVVQLGANGAIRDIQVQTLSNIGPNAVSDRDRDSIVPTNGQRGR